MKAETYNEESTTMKPYRLLGVMMVLLMAVCIADIAGARMYRPFSQDARLYSPPPPDRYGGMVVVKFHNGQRYSGGAGSYSVVFISRSRQPRGP